MRSRPQPMVHRFVVLEVAIPIHRLIFSTWRGIWILGHEVLAFHCDGTPLSLFGLGSRMRNEWKIEERLGVCGPLLYLDYRVILRSAVWTLPPVFPCRCDVVIPVFNVLGSTLSPGAWFITTRNRGAELKFWFATWILSLATHHDFFRRDRRTILIRTFKHTFGSCSILSGLSQCVLAAAADGAVFSSLHGVTATWCLNFWKAIQRDPDPTVFWPNFPLCLLDWKRKKITAQMLRTAIA